MFSTRTAQKAKVFIATKKGKIKKYGRVRNVVFHPSKAQAVGVTVKRPDLLWMIKRKDRFAALDSIGVMEDGNYLVKLDDAGAWDRAACKRMGIDFDVCIIWDNMPVRSLNGDELGLISNVAIEEKTMRIVSIDISENSVNRAILGSADIAADKIRGYQDGAIVVDATRGDVQVNGGVAAKAGEAWATTTHKASKAQEKTTEAAAEAIEQGAFKAGEALGSAKEKWQEAGVGKKAENAINEGAYKLGRAIGNLTRDDEEDKAEKASSKKAPEKDASTAKKASGSNAAAAKKKAASDEDTYEAAAKKVGEHLGRVGGMFGAFKEEFDKASKGE